VAAARGGGGGAVGGGAVGGGGGASPSREARGAAQHHVWRAARRGALDELRERLEGACRGGRRLDRGVAAAGREAGEAAYTTQRCGITVRLNVQWV